MEEYEELSEYEKYEKKKYEQKRKIRVEKPDGEIGYIDLPTTHQAPPILHSILEQDVLDRIENIYSEIKDVLQDTTNPPMNLESFELAFMGDIDPLKSVKKWEKIVRVYKKAHQYMGDDLEIRKKTYSILLYHSMGSLLPEEEQQSGIKFLMTLYDESE